MRKSLYDYCAGRKVLAGLNDLTTLEPETTAPWHTTLNGTLTPDTVAAGSHRKAWWQCPSGHVWKAMIYARAGPQKSGCPVCAGKARKDRETRYRASLAEYSQITAQAVFEIDEI